MRRFGRRRRVAAPGGKPLQILAAPFASAFASARSTQSARTPLKCSGGLALDLSTVFDDHLELAPVERVRLSGGVEDPRTKLGMKDAPPWKLVMPAFKCYIQNEGLASAAPCTSFVILELIIYANASIFGSPPLVPAQQEVPGGTFSGLWGVEDGVAVADMLQACFKHLQASSSEIVVLHMPSTSV